MRTPFLLLVIAMSGLLFSSPARAVDYAKVDRTIAREPAYRESPKYALLLFGKEGRLRVWAVLDCQALYLDRDGDGDLTGKGKRFARLEDCRDVDLRDPDGKTRYRIESLGTFKDREGAQEYLMVNVRITGPVSYGQYCSVELRGHRREARVAHFHGPLAIGPRTVRWKVPADLALVAGGKPTDLSCHAGTMEAEHGCWVVVRSHDGDKAAFPEGVGPVVDVEFPPKAPGDPPVKRRYELKGFC